jgi:hypothetical protein
MAIEERRIKIIMFYNTTEIRGTQYQALPGIKGPQ